MGDEEVVRKKREQLSAKIDYSKVLSVYPTYEQRKLIPNTGSQSLGLSLVGGEEAVFELAKGAMNFAISELQFTATPAAADAATIAHWMFMGCPAPFRRIQLYSADGPFLVDTDHCANVYEIIWLALDTDEWASRPRMSPIAVGDPGGYMCTWGYFLNLRNGGTLSRDQVAFRPDIHLIRSHVSSFTERRYLLNGALGAANPIAIVRQPLGDFVHTLLGVNKDIYFDTIMYLRFVFNPSTKVMFKSDFVSLGPHSGNAAATHSCNLTLLTLQMAYEIDQGIVKSMRDRVRGPGFKMLMPFITTTKTALVASTEQNVTIKFAKARSGSRIMRIYHAVFHATETGITAYDHANLAGTPLKITSFHTEVNYERQQPRDLATATFDDYTWLKKKLPRAMGLQTLDIFRKNSFWMDDFTDGNVWDNNLIQGMELRDDGSDMWTFNSSRAVSTAGTHFTATVSQKVLDIQGTQVTAY